MTSLADSMRSIGLQTPISVRIVPEFRDEDGSVTADVPILVAGRHRLEAAKSLGWATIDAFVMEGAERDFRLWEIAENLHRAELTVAERAEHIAEWVRLAAEKMAQVAPLSAEHGKRGAGLGNEGGVRAAVRELGIDRTEASAPSRSPLSRRRGKRQAG